MKRARRKSATPTTVTQRMIASSHKRMNLARSSYHRRESRFYANPTESNRKAMESAKQRWDTAEWRHGRLVVKFHAQHVGKEWP